MSGFWDFVNKIRDDLEEKEKVKEVGVTAINEDVFKPASEQELQARAETSPFNTDLTIDQIRPDTERRTLNRVTVYADIDRPINRGDVRGDIAWRRMDHGKANKDKILNALEPFFTEKAVTRDDITFFSYDTYAGCSMCPCSPGFVIKFSKNLDRSYDIWLKPVGLKKV